MKSIEERITSKTIPIPECGCWIWMGATNPWGYGNIMIAGKTRSVHRVIWETHNGSIPNGMLVCHTCDTPSCINPRHLYLGTPKTNSNDCWGKKRGRTFFMIGEKHVNAKLTDEQILEIRINKKTYKKIAEEYGINFTYVSHIKHRRCWKHI